MWMRMFTMEVNTADENFVYENSVKKIMMGLKIKNIEEVDRIPLRILNDGVEQRFPTTGTGPGTGT